MGVTVGLEVMTHCSLPCLTAGPLDADAVSNQTDDMEVARLVYRWRRGRAGRRSSQLNGIIYTEVLQLNQLTFRHPVLDGDTDMSGERLLSMS